LPCITVVEIRDPFLDLGPSFPSLASVFSKISVHRRFELGAFFALFHRLTYGVVFREIRTQQSKPAIPMNRTKPTSAAIFNSFNQFNLINVAAFIFLLSPTILHATDWPQWRGPARDGVSKEKGLLKEWPKDGPKLLWQVKDIGAGFSTPAVVGDRLYVLANEGLDNEFVEALSVSDGKKIWSTKIGKVGKPDQQPNYPAARSTPTVDADSIYALGSDGDIAALDLAGKLRWKKNLRADFGGVPGKWAYAESPLIDGDTLVCTPGGTTATLVALSKKSGDLIWKTAIPEGDPAAYASAMILDPAAGSATRAASGGVKQYVQMLEKGLVGVDAKTGKVLWRADKTVSKFGATIPTPVVYDSEVYSAGSGTGGALVKLKSTDGKVEPEQVYFSPKLPTAIGGAVKVGDLLFGTTATGLSCSEFANGKIKWEDHAIGPASICCADGNLYLHGENGEVALVAAAADAYHEKGRFKPADQPDRGSAKAWAYPIVANGKLYIRDVGTLWCYDVKAM
jgi:outer membrane protein assembly factor BamB